LKAGLERAEKILGLKLVTELIKNWRSNSLEVHEKKEKCRKEAEE